MKNVFKHGITILIIFSVSKSFSVELLTEREIKQNNVADGLVTRVINHIKKSREENSAVPASDSVKQIFLQESISSKDHMIKTFVYLRRLGYLYDINDRIALYRFAKKQGIKFEDYFMESDVDEKLAEIKIINGELSREQALEYIDQTIEKSPISDSQLRNVYEALVESGRGQIQAKEFIQTVIRKSDDWGMLSSFKSYLINSQNQNDVEWLWETIDQFPFSKRATIIANICARVSVHASEVYFKELENTYSDGKKKDFKVNAFVINFTLNYLMGDNACNIDSQLKETIILSLDKYKASHPDELKKFTKSISNYNPKTSYVSNEQFKNYSSLVVFQQKLTKYAHFVELNKDLYFTELYASASKSCKAKGEEYVFDKLEKNSELMVDKKWLKSKKTKKNKLSSIHFLFSEDDCLVAQNFFPIENKDDIQTIINNNLYKYVKPTHELGVSLLELSGESLQSDRPKALFTYMLPFVLYKDSEVDQLSWRDPADGRR